METYKRRRGDRKDGRLLRELDSLHFITGIIYPNRCDNEAYISVKVDLTALKRVSGQEERGGEGLSLHHVSHRGGGAGEDHHPAAKLEPLYL